MTAKQRQVFAEEMAADLKGTDVIITGHKVNGQAYTRRRLNNVTIDVRGDLIKGFCPIAQAVREFRLSLVQVIEAAPDQTQKGGPEGEESRRMAS